MRRRPPGDARPGPAALLAAALLAALPTPRGAGALEEPPPGGGGALRISASPPRLVLGSDAGADLHVQAPPEVEELSLLPSVGRVEGLRRLPGGGFTARYRPPAERFPQVAILAAMARTPRGVADGWLAIPLSGQGEARVRATPGAEITLRIGDRAFGPRRADAQGLALIPVVVPPGIRQAHHGFRAVDLNVPETPLLHAVADRGAVQADRAEQVRVLVYVVAPHGAARRGDLPAFEPSRGAVSVAAREPGAFEALWSLPPGPAGVDRLVIRLPGSAVSRTVLRLDAVPGPPAAVAVTFDREAVVAGAAEPVGVTARVVDAAGNAVAAPVSLAAEGAALSSPEPAGAGAVSARLSVGPRFAGRREVVVRARSAEAGVSGARAIPLVAGPVAAGRIAPREAVLHVDGRGELSLRVAFVDRYQNPVRTAPAVTAERGEVLAVGPADEGAWLVRYRTPDVRERTPERVVAQLGAVRADADLLLVPPRGVSILASGGAMFDLRGRFQAPRLGLALEGPAPSPRLVDPLAAGWRVELAGFGYGAEVAGLEQVRQGLVPRRVHGDVRGGVALVGLSLARERVGGPELRGSLGVGALLARVSPEGPAPAARGAAPALQAALALGWPGRLATPFLEATLLAAGRSPAGELAAAGLSLGIRFDPGEERWRRSSSSTTSR